MIIDKEVQVKLSGRNRKTYKDLGYDVSGDTVMINPNHLTKGSKTIVNVKCDVCGFEKSIPYQKYYKNFSKYNIYTCCTKCAQVKNEMTNMEKYGTKHPMQNKEVIQKTINTVKEKYGVENIFQLTTTKEKAIKTNLEKRGVEYAMQSEKVQEKRKETFLESYGVEFPSQSPELIEEYRKSCYSTFIEKYGEKYDIENIDYINYTIDIKCKTCHKISTFNLKTFFSRHARESDLCVYCNPLGSLTSEVEKELLSFIKSVYKEEIIENDRTILDGKELDIYLPNKKIAFEFNGLYWHSSKFKESDYHLNKTDMCLEKEIHLIHIYEDEWYNKKDIIKSRIKNILGLNEIKIYGRKCIIKEITDNKIIRTFLNDNHIQGFCNSSVKLGLYYKDELVSLMTFGSLRKILGQDKKEGSFELLRFCNKSNTNVLGGASKLFKYFVNNYDFNDIISYADRSWSKGGLYENLKFEYISSSKPNYHYVINDSREYRFKYRKDVLVKEGFDSNLTEEQIMLDRGYYRIYNSGNLKYIYKKKNI